MITRRTPQPTDKHVGARVRMRRLMLNMSQTKLADALQLTFQQVQKYERGMNRIGAGLLQQIANVLQVHVEFFFDGSPTSRGQPFGTGETPTPDYMTDFLASADGLALTKAFMRIRRPALRRSIVKLVEEIGREPA